MPAILEGIAWHGSWHEPAVGLCWPGGGIWGNPLGRVRPRGNIETLASRSLRVRVYAGVDVITGRELYLKQTIAAGPTAQRLAEDSWPSCCGRSSRAVSRGPMRRCSSWLSVTWRWPAWSRGPRRPWPRNHVLAAQHPSQPAPNHGGDQLRPLLDAVLATATITAAQTHQNANPSQASPDQEAMNVLVSTQSPGHRRRKASPGQKGN